MSIKLMAAAWDANIPSTEKMVLLCLCDFANDTGVCWPAVKTIAAKCGMSDRTVQGAIKRLRDEGFCSWNDAPGKPHLFRLDPRKICTPEDLSPPKKTSKPPKILHHTPEDSSDKPSKNHQEPSNNITRPPDVSDEVWSDFLQHRKRQRADVTKTAMKRISAEAAKAGWALEDALAEIVARGWRGLKAEWLKENGNGKRSTGGSTADTAQRVRERFGLA